jgi:hypothetical protein
VIQKLLCFPSLKFRKSSVLSDVPSWFVALSRTLSPMHTNGFDIDFLSFFGRFQAQVLETGDHIRYEEVSGLFFYLHVL